MEEGDEVGAALSREEAAGRGLEGFSRESSLFGARFCLSYVRFCFYSRDFHVRFCHGVVQLSLAEPRFELSHPSCLPKGTAIVRGTSP